MVLGVLGQDGSYLAEHLAEAGHQVAGLIHSWPRTSGRFARLNHLLTLPGFRWVGGDLTDQESIDAAVRDTQPDEVYNLAAVTAPGGAWGTVQPADLADVTAVGVQRVLDAVRTHAPDARIVHASSSAVYDPHRYGLYGISKRFAHDTVVGYRAGFGMHASNAVLYSHTSPRQDGRFLAPTVCATLTRIAAGADERLTLTELGGARDWGWAPSFVRALPLIARQDTPGDYDVATGTTHTVFDFVDAALTAAGLTWDQAVTVVDGPPAPRERPAGMRPLAALGWEQAVTFERMVELMVTTAPRESTPGRLP